MLYQEKWPPRPEAAPPEAPKNWGNLTGAYNTIIFGTTHDLRIHMYQTMKDDTAPGILGPWRRPSNNNNNVNGNINWSVFENAAKKNVYLTVFSRIGQGAGPRADIR